MNTAIKLDTDCKSFRSNMIDLLLEPLDAATHPDLYTHLASCSRCSTELNELRATVALLDEYTAPEPSAYFDTRLHARLREVQVEAPEGIFRRLRAFMLFGTGHKFQPAMAAALALVLVAGGGETFWQMHNGQSASASHAPVASATVNDLNILDNNAQAEQQMGQLLDQSDTDDGDATPAS